MAMLEVEHINKSFGRTEVLKDVNFSLEKGQKNHGDSYKITKQGNKTLSYS